MEKKTKAKANKRKLTGTVVSVANSKTISVKVDTQKLHPKYQKFYISSKKYQVHNDKHEVKAGDKVRFVECRPISKTKRWYLSEVLKK